MPSMKELIRRLRAAAKVLAGVRPAEARFDERDQEIASDCARLGADWAAEGIAFFDPDTSLDDIHPRFREAAYHAAIWAVVRYATYGMGADGFLPPRHLPADGPRSERPRASGPERPG